MDPNRISDPADAELAAAVKKLGIQGILVTGASGFLGGRLVEMMVSNYGLRPRVLVRNASKTRRIASMLDELELVQGSIADQTRVIQAMQGRRVVFHCAFDGADTNSNIDGIRNLIEACLAEGARLIHVSSFAVYSPYAFDTLTEDAVPPHPVHPYPTIKLKLEECIWTAVATRKLDAVVVMPTIIYGAFGGTWTIGPAKQLMNGTVILPANGTGLCNAVYVDDVCQALLRAAIASNPVGRRYFVSAATPVTWKEYFEAYAREMGCPGPDCSGNGDTKPRRIGAYGAIKNLIGDPKRITQNSVLRTTALWIRDRIGASARERLTWLYGRYRRIAPRVTDTPKMDLIELFSARCRVVVTRAEKELGYRPAYTLALGMEKTGVWLRETFGTGRGGPIMGGP